MASFTPSTSDSPVPASAQEEFRDLPEVLEEIRRGLSTAENLELEGLFHNARKSMEKWEYRRSIANIFEFSSYTDNCKKYFAASRVDSEVVLLLGDRFLTEEIIVGYIKKLGKKQPISRSYFDALIRSSHMSGRIVEAALKNMSNFDTKRALVFSPDAFITSGVILAWISNAEGLPEMHLPLYREFAALRIRKAHPEYEGFPDDWTLKVFCGE